MSQTQILNKIQEEPDLQDVVEYLIQPFSLINDLKTRYSKLQSHLQNNISNKEILFKMDNLVNNHLNQLIENYCSLSLKYRNENIIKTKVDNDSEKFYTTKELLLENISKIIEEIKILEEKFNQNNLIGILAQSRRIETLGFQPTYNNGKLTQEKSLKLENKFNYSDFVNKSNTQRVSCDKFFFPLEVDNVFIRVHNKLWSKKEKFLASILVGFTGILLYFGLNNITERSVQYHYHYVFEKLAMVKKEYPKAKIDNDYIFAYILMPLDVLGKKRNRLWFNDSEIVVNTNEQSETIASIKNVDEKTCIDLVEEVNLTRLIKVNGELTNTLAANKNCESKNTLDISF